MILRLLPVLFCILTGIACRQNHTRQSSVVQPSVSGENYIRIDEPVEWHPAWSKENKVVVQWLAEPDQLHPTNGVSNAKNELFIYLHTFLVLVNLQTQELIPVLAAHLPELSPDGKEITFQLREQARWDDGSPITSYDVEFTIKAGKCRLTDNAHQKAIWENVNSIRHGNDGRTFTLRMKKPYIHNVAMWTDLAIIQKKFYDPQGLLDPFSIEQMEDSASVHWPQVERWAAVFNSGKFSRDIRYISGAGLYRITTWEAGQSITLTKKENHWSEGIDGLYFNARPEKIVFRIIRDPQAAMLDLLALQSDVSLSLSTRHLIQLREDSLFTRHYHSRFIDTYFYTYAAMNNRPEIAGRKKLFHQPAVRKAMAWLTPVDQMNRLINKGLNKRMIGPVSFLKKDFNKELKPLPYDPARAARYLSLAGWTDSDGNRILDRTENGIKLEFEFTLTYLTTAPEWKDMAMMMADAYRKAGMKVDLLAVDYPAWMESARTMNFDMLLGAWGQSSLPDDFTQLWHTRSILSGGNNFSGFGNPYSDALIDSIKTEMNEQKRIQLSRRFQKLVYEEQPVIFLFSSIRRVAIHKRFENIELYFDRPGILLHRLSVISSSSAVP